MTIGGPHPGMGSLAIAPRDAAGRAVSAAIAFHLRALIRRQPAAAAGAAEPVHQMRVATRRLRAALRLFAGVLRPGPVEAARRDLAWLAEAIGALRDLDVLGQSVAKRARKLPPDLAGALAPLRRRICDKRQARQEELRQTLESSRYRRLLMRLSSLAPAARSFEVPIAAVAPDLARPLLSSVKRRGRKLGSKSPAARLHRFRVRVKRLRYALEIMRGLGGKSLKRLLLRLERMQESLGQHHDCMTAVAWLRAYAGSALLPPQSLLAIGALIQETARGGQRLEHRCVRMWNRLDRSGLARAALRELRSAQQARRTHGPAGSKALRAVVRPAGGPRRQRAVAASPSTDIRSNSPA